MDEGRPEMLLVWLECSSRGQIDKGAHEFNFPADVAEDMELLVWQDRDQCGRHVNIG